MGRYIRWIFYLQRYAALKQWTPATEMFKHNSVFALLSSPFVLHRIPPRCICGPNATQAKSKLWKASKVEWKRIGSADLHCLFHTARNTLLLVNWKLGMMILEKCYACAICCKFAQRAYFTPNPGNPLLLWLVIGAIDVVHWYSWVPSYYYCNNVLTIKYTILQFPV